MASERSTERLLDLLYDELSADEASAVRKEIEESAELRSEYEDLQAMLGRIEESMPLEDPPASVHMSIMDAAREAVTSNVEDEVRAVRRTPREASAGRGFWGRLSGSQVSQVALVATVLLAGAFMFKVVGLDQAQEPAMARLEERALPGAAAPMAPADAPAEEAKEMAEGEADSAAREAKLNVPEGVAAADKGSVDLADRMDDSDGMVGRAGLADELAEKPAETVTTTRRSSKADAAKRDEKKAEPAPAQKPRPMRSAAPSKKKMAPKTKSKAVGGEALDSLLSNDDSWGGSASNTTSGAAKRPAVQAKEEMAFDVQAPAAAEAEPTASPAEAEDAPAPEQKKAEAYRPQSGTLESVEAYYSAGDYRQTVSEADRVLGANVPAAQKGRALELKAQAYRRMDQLSQADAVYRNLQRNYPDYAPARITAARQEISRILGQKRERSKRKAAPERAYDFESDNFAPTLE